MEANQRVENITLKITKVSKYIPSFDFDEEYDEKSAGMIEENISEDNGHERR